MASGHFRGFRTACPMQRAGGIWQVHIWFTLHMYVQCWVNHLQDRLVLAFEEDRPLGGRNMAAVGPNGYPRPMKGHEAGTLPGEKRASESQDSRG